MGRKTHIELEEGYREIIPKIFEKLVNAIPLIPYSRSLAEQVRQILNIVSICLDNSECKKALAKAYIVNVLKKSKLRPEELLATASPGTTVPPYARSVREVGALADLDVIKDEELEKLLKLCPGVKVFPDKNEVRIPVECLENNEEVKKMYQEFLTRMSIKNTKQLKKLLGGE